MGATACTECREGTFADSPTDTCLACPDNTFSPSNGTISCTKCPDGTVPNTDKTQCYKPPSGLSVGAAAGIAIAGVVFLTGVGVGVAVVLKRMKQAKKGGNGLDGIVAGFQQNPLYNQVKEMENPL